MDQLLDEVHGYHGAICWNAVRPVRVDDEHEAVTDNFVYVYKRIEVGLDDVDHVLVEALADADHVPLALLHQHLCAVHDVNANHDDIVFGLLEDRRETLVEGSSEE